MTKDIRLLPCFTPPSKEVLIKKVLAVAKKNDWELGFSDENKPDKAWLIKFLSTYSEKDEIFAKSYVAPPIRKKKEEEKVHKMKKSLFEDMPAKKPGRRVKQMKLQIFKEGRRK